MFGDAVSLEPLFVLPVLFVSWYGTSRSGISLAVLSSLMLVFSKEMASTSIFTIEHIVLSGFVHALAYSFLAILITNFRSVHRVEVTAADTDNLTGIHNSRSFYAALAIELLRSNRYKHIFSLAYIDIDNFKYINDSLGHSIGDKLLIEVANCLESSLRKTDIVARIGGDEYVCLLPETEQEEAKHAFIKVRKVLEEHMKANNWSVSFSIGLVTFETLPDDIQEAMKIADDLMYMVKNDIKDDIAYNVWHGKA